MHHISNLADVRMGLILYDVIIPPVVRSTYKVLRRTDESRDCTVQYVNRDRILKILNIHFEI